MCSIDASSSVLPAIALLASVTDCTQSVPNVCASLWRPDDLRVVQSFHGLSYDRIRSEFAAPFDNLRTYVSSGRSGSCFVESRTGLLLLKSIRSPEVRCLQANFAGYIHRITSLTPPSLLMPIFALILVRGGPSFILIRNVTHRPDGTYIVGRLDLKGRSNKRPPARGPQPLACPYLDKDITRVRTSWPLLPHLRDALVASLVADVAFLNSCNIIDYSLLIAVVAATPHWQKTVQSGPSTRSPPLDPLSPASQVWFRLANGGLHTGLGEVWHVAVIDCLTPWNAQKVTANLIKRVRWPQSTLSTIRPAQYAARFLSFMCTVLQGDVSPPPPPNFFYLASSPEGARSERDSIPSYGKPILLNEPQSSVKRF